MTKYVQSCRVTSAYVFMPTVPVVDSPVIVPVIAAIMPLTLTCEPVAAWVSGLDSSACGASSEAVSFLRISRYRSRLVRRLNLVSCCRVPCAGLVSLGGVFVQLFVLGGCPVCS
ncbi:hypothetical protein, partial [Faecalibaculum rodentium]|uniref:hypothetical protein n=1 Tax=Faecalibaculum rodentium TaxID=1702221 RepID=UPI0023F492A9